MNKQLETLSSAYKKKFEESKTYARCPNCKGEWVDDIPIIGVAVMCPNPDCKSWALERVTDLSKE